LSPCSAYCECPAPPTSPLIRLISPAVLMSLFFFHYTSTTALYTLSLHDALPIYSTEPRGRWPERGAFVMTDQDDLLRRAAHARGDRKSTRLNSSHEWISYAVFCLKKKKNNKKEKNKTPQAMNT